MNRKAQLALSIFLLFFSYRTAAQHTFYSHFKSLGTVSTNNLTGTPRTEIGSVKPGNFIIQCASKGDGMVIQFLQKNEDGEWTAGPDWNVTERPTQYFADNPKSILYKAVTNFGDNARIVYVKGSYLMFLTTIGSGWIYYEQNLVEATDILKEAFDVIQADGKTVYHYNHSAEVSAWTSSLLSGDDNRLIFLAPEEGAEYRIQDTMNSRRYSFLQTQPYSSLLFREQLGDPLHFNGDTITLTRDYLKDRNDRIPKQFRYMWYYPDNIELLTWSAECPSCTSENWNNWETSKGMLLFTCNDIARVKLEVKYRLIKPKLTSGKTDTIRILKTIRDTVFIDSKIKPKPAAGRSVVEKETLKIKSQKLTIAVWDNAGIDGDIISLQLNGKVILSNLRLDKCKTTFTIDLDPGENILIMKAENLGTSPPNTASFLFTTESFKKFITLRSDMGYSESVKILVE